MPRAPPTSSSSIQSFTNQISKHFQIHLPPTCATTISTLPNSVCNLSFLSNINIPLSMITLAINLRNPFLHLQATFCYCMLVFKCLVSNATTIHCCQHKFYLLPPLTSYHVDGYQVNYDRCSGGGGQGFAQTLFHQGLKQT